MQNIFRIQVVKDYFKEVIYGGIDGIVTTFAVVAGFTGAAVADNAVVELSFVVVLLFGLANLFADAASMGLGNYLSVRSEQDMYEVARAKEAALLTAETDKEVAATVEILIEKGFSREQADTIASIYQHNPEYWLDFMMNHEHAVSDPRSENPVYTGLATFFSFLVFGSIPLIPFMVATEANADTVFLLSATGTFLALITLGLMKWKVIGARLWSSLFEVILVGGTAALIAYIVGTFFGG